MSLWDGKMHLVRVTQWDGDELRHPVYAFVRERAGDKEALFVWAHPDATNMLGASFHEAWIKGHHDWYDWHPVGDRAVIPREIPEHVERLAAALIMKGLD